MHRSGLTFPRYSQPQPWQLTWARSVSLLALWIFASFGLRYGYYGNRHIELGPSSSRLFKASSIFVEEIQVSDDSGKGVFVYGFLEKPELSLDTEWNASSYLIARAYRCQGFYLWLNRGSNIRLKWKAQTSTSSDLVVALSRGESNFETVLPNTESFTITKSTKGHGEAKYMIEEDDSYYISILNSSNRSVLVAMTVNVASKMHDTSKAKSVCSTVDGLCRFKLQFPKTQYVVLTTPNNGHFKEWYIELSFMARLLTYIAILGFIAFVIYMILKYLGGLREERTTEESTRASETEPLVPEKVIPFTYGTDIEDQESGIRGSSSDDLYDGKICVICYDEQRNCFFVPCGHCATCHECAQRIFDGESRACPICRRFIHKVRKIIIP